MENSTLRKTLSGHDTAVAQAESRREADNSRKAGRWRAGGGVQMESTGRGSGGVQMERTGRGSDGKQMERTENKSRLNRSGSASRLLKSGLQP